MAATAPGGVGTTLLLPARLRRSDDLSGLGRGRLQCLLGRVVIGPAAHSYVGRVVFNVDADGVFTLESTSGTATDICAALS